MASATAFAQVEEYDYSKPIEAGFSLSLGYKLIDVGKLNYSHDTHPDDSSLPNAGVPGSAGDTSFNGVFHMAAVGVRYTQPITGQIHADFDTGMLFTYAFDKEKNANDSRPDSQASFVYSQAYLGVYLAAGVSYQFGRFSLGATAQVAAIEVDSGWDRMGKLQSQYSTTEFAFSIGPTVGFRLDERLSLEASMGIGDRATASIMAVWTF